MVLWDFFFNAQQALDVQGNLLEIGVYKGRSAVLSSLYARPNERAVFVDLWLPEDIQNLIHRAKPHNCLFLQRRSSDLLAEETIRNSPYSFRWCHIDGDHTGYAAARDLCAAAYLTSEMGIICVDDFFNLRYPQLTAAVYAFLSDRDLEFRMLFCGANKCYICRSPAYRQYEAYLRAHLVTHIQLHQIESQIYKTSFAHDRGCFSMWTPDGDRPIYGMDENPDFVPF
jgi:hypothetical protein